VSVTNPRIGDGRKVLVLEDEPAVQLLVKKALMAYGFAVETAKDGLEGLVKLETLRPDLIISDIMMPQLDGLTFVRAIKARNETKTIPVIFLTAKADPKTMIDGINVGARFYLTKPFGIEDLITKVTKALGI
jgi:DNA-binding response OmpR family regulator